MPAEQAGRYGFVSILTSLKRDAQTSVIGSVQNYCGTVVDLRYHAATFALTENHVEGLLHLRGDNGNNTRTNNCRLLRGDVCESLAEILLMIHGDGRDGDCFGSGHGR